MFSMFQLDRKGGEGGIMTSFDTDSWSSRLRAAPGAMDFERGRTYLALLVAALLLLLLEGVSLPMSLALGGFLQFLLYKR